MKNEWLVKRLCMGHPAAINQLVNRIARSRKDAKKAVKSKERTRSHKSPNT